jgi:two-component sensor histidine kinase
MNGVLAMTNRAEMLHSGDERPSTRGQHVRDAVRRVPYTSPMDGSLTFPPGLTAAERRHLGNVADNLQLVADMGYGDVALALKMPDGALRIAADARPMTAVAAVASSRVGHTLGVSDETEAYTALRSGGRPPGGRRRSTRGIAYTTFAYPVCSKSRVIGVLLRHLALQVGESPGKMEVAFMDLADDLISVLEQGPILDASDSSPFVTGRRAGDGVIRLDETGAVVYASPNAFNILKAAGVESGLMGMAASEMPGGAVAVAPVLRSGGARAMEVEVGGSVLSYRTIAFKDSALVLVEDVSETRRREQELKVKEATIREVHHRVKNNLQTIASLLRIQARRTDSEAAAHALSEAVERVSSMAVVHELLAASTEERVDFEQAARTVVDMVRQGLAGASSAIEVTVEGATGQVPASTATSLALVLAELVHNAIEHGIADRGEGVVRVTMRRLPAELHLVVRDDGAGLPAGFDLASSANLGLAIVRTVVEDDLRGTLSFGGGRGTTVTIRVPVEPAPDQDGR